MRKILAFATIFMGRFTVLRTDRFYSYWASPTAKLALGHYGIIKELLHQATELHNEIFWETPLITKDDDKSLVEDKDTIMIDKININGDKVPYAQFFLLSLDVRTVNAGLTINFGVVDESQEVLAEHFKIQVAPMTNRKLFPFIAI